MFFNNSKQLKASHNWLGGQRKLGLQNICVHIETEIEHEQGYKS